MSVACGGGYRGEKEPTGQPTSFTAGDSASDTTHGDPTASSAVTEGDDETNGGTKLDVAPPDTDAMTAGDGGDQSGCDKVDFLFIIDNSGSMGDEQGNLINSFPLFIDTIQSTLDEAQDYHLMVLDVDAWQYETCQQMCTTAPPECINPMGLCDPTVGPACLFPCFLGAVCGLDGGYQCGVTMPEVCEDVLGAGVTHPRGQGSSNMDCNFSTGARYMDSNEPDLSAAFECAAQVGVSSYAGTERPMEAMVQAVTSGTEAEPCNTGFLRDDAILVVTFITDEDDGNGDSAGTPAGWKQALVAAKNGDESAIVVLGLFGDNDMPGGICQDLADGSDGAEAAPRLRQFVDSFGDKGFFGSVCAPSYDSFFQDAVALIDSTCEEFIPPEG
ncbi:hypothetical protein [Paraliomyxa miuraensis]|uniref:hypothetical protein n=1 Tax=Paraliomyxa miuraensis TaxID=376150 RepID=UPI0022583245|nr:hypothetical protein [Paraliomyxa miuraensis]MCX4239931.1 hypothetical protein [Paraliomyxa miuraensis]